MVLHDVSVLPNPVPPRKQVRPVGEIFLEFRFFKWFIQKFSTNSIFGWMASMNKSNVSLLSVLTSSSVTLTFDTGPTKACTPNKSEFISFRKTTGKNIGGIANDLSIEGEGTVKYLVYASNGTPITF